MNLIWKYQLPISPGTFELDMPVGSVVLSVATQGNTAQLWAMHECEDDMSKRTFLAAYTGTSFDEIPVKFLGTVEIKTRPTMPLVIHYFEL